ncbi:hypothetical protein CRV15_09905 [Streptomyces clavuligerus]|nr:hypothetical protein D1794_10475 [Streptomyces clavuligerus]QCS05906.1 hypothetical protein CRV15_09905 [Streptomyces clavuligerus]
MPSIFSEKPAPLNAEPVPGFFVASTRSRSFASADWPGFSAPAAPKVLRSTSTFRQVPWSSHWWSMTMSRPTGCSGPHASV